MLVCSSEHLSGPGTTGTSPFVSPCYGGLGEMCKSPRFGHHATTKIHS